MTSPVWARSPSGRSSTRCGTGASPRLGGRPAWSASGLRLGQLEAESVTGLRNRSSLIPGPSFLVILLALTLSATAGAEEPLWGEVASTLGKGFVNVTTQGLLQ